MHPDQKYLSYLQLNDRKGIDELYRLYAGKVQRMIVANQGTEEDAADIFQESLIDIYKRNADGKFILTCPFEAFIIIICKRKWLNVLKKRGRSPVTNQIEELSTYREDDLREAEEQALKTEQENTIMQLLEEMGATCKAIIKACMLQKHQEQVAESLGFTYAYLRKKKSECMAGLGKMVKAHPAFRNNSR